MLGFKAHKETSIKAASQAIFDIVGDITPHHELAGSGEVLRVRKLTEGPVGMGTKFESDEDIPMGPQHSRFVAGSEVVAFDPPKIISWTSMPSSPPKPLRIQWWFRLTPESDSTRVSHDVEVDFGAISNFLLKLPYAAVRGGRINRGMAKTLQNLKQLAEKQAPAGQ